MCEGGAGVDIRVDIPDRRIVAHVAIERARTGVADQPDGKVLISTQN
jgi:hypothetical protein